MNIYDFDNTIYDGNTNIDLILYSFVRHPFKLSKSLIITVPLFIGYKFKKVSFKRLKENMLSFLFKIDNLDEYLDLFAEKHMKKIKKWYLDNQKDNDTVMSASYEIWISKFCKKLNIKNVISTKTDDNGKIIGNNCKGEEKVIRFRKEFPNEIVNNAYSDSIKEDKSMLSIAKKAYLVKKNELIEYK